MLESTMIIEELQGAFHNSMQLLNSFIDICPEEIWKEEFGKWPVWQHLCHVFNTIDFLVLDENAALSQNLFPTDVAGLDVVAKNAPDKAKIKELATIMQATADKYIGTLLKSGRGNAILEEKHEGVSSRMVKYGRPSVTHAVVLVELNGHSMYHLGICDSALRQHGLKGVF